MRLDSETVAVSPAVEACHVHPAATAVPVGTRVAIAVSRYNAGITGKLLEGAVATLNAAGLAGDAIEIAWVPGAFELPLAADRLAATGRVAAVLCLGAVIRGETTHDRHINTAVATGLESVGRQYGLPVLFGVLTCETVGQAEARAGGAVGNKGQECAEAALAMISLLAGLSAAAAPAT